MVCCRSYDWTSSLWLPLSQLVARLLCCGVVVAPQQEIPLTRDAPHMPRGGAGGGAASGTTTATSGATSTTATCANSSRFVLRVYGGLVSSLGLYGGFLERACCMLDYGEEVDYEGGITWSRPKGAWQGPFSGIVSSAASAFFPKGEKRLRRLQSEPKKMRYIFKWSSLLFVVNVSHVSFRVGGCLRAACHQIEPRSLIRKSHRESFSS